METIAATTSDKFLSRSVVGDKVEIMDTQEAANELGMSARSLQRAVSKNKLSVTYRRGKSGKMEAVYDPDEVARYKAELAEVIKPEGLHNQHTALVPTTRDSEASQVVAQLLQAVLTHGIEAQNKVLPLVPVSQKLMLSLVEAAELSGLSKGILREAINKKKLKAKIIGRGWRVKRSDLDAYIQKL